MSDFDKRILEMKSNGASLRKIAATLKMSHETVRKRLRGLVRENQVSTHKENKRLTALVIENEGVSTFSNAHESKVSEKIGDTVNQVSTKKTPSVTISQGVNPLKTTSTKPAEGMKGVLSELDDLFGAIKDFLESKGIEVYRMHVEQEAYQARHNGQTVRFYVHRER